MTTYSTSSSRRPLLAPRTQEVSGQCKKCLDLFGVDVYFSHGHLYAVQTNHLSWNHSAQHLIHKPGKCDGKVHLYGSTENLIERTSNDLARYARYQQRNAHAARYGLSEAV